MEGPFKNFFLSFFLYSSYTTDNIPDLSVDEHFQVWMRTAGLPTFRKLYGRFDSDLEAGIYDISITDSIALSYFFFLLFFPFPPTPFSRNDLQTIRFWPSLEPRLW